MDNFNLSMGILFSIVVTTLIGKELLFTVVNFTHFFIWILSYIIILGMIWFCASIGEQDIRNENQGLN